MTVVESPAVTRKGQVNLRLTDELREALTEASAQLGISQSALVEQTMRERLAVLLGRPVAPAAPRHRLRQEPADAEPDDHPDA